jgi:aspartate aminotransferase
LADRVVVFPGAKPVIGLCQQTFCNPGDEIIYPSPGFPIYESFITYLGAQPVPVHLSEEGNFTLSGMDIVTILLNGAAKSFSWIGTRIGWALLPTVEEAEVFTNLNINYFSCIPPYNQEGACIALVSPRSQDSVRHTVTVFQERRDLVVNGLNAIKGINCQKPKGTFYVFPNISEVCENLRIMDMFRSLPPDLKGETSPSTLLQMFLLFEYQVATMDRKSFGRIGAESFHYLRFCFATDTESLKEGLRRISAASEDTERFRYFSNRGEHLS